MEKTNEQLDYLVRILEQWGIRVDRPTPLQWNQAVDTPVFKSGAMFGCMPPRDVLLTVGKEILSAPMSFRTDAAPRHTTSHRHFAIPASGYR